MTTRPQVALPVMQVSDLEAVGELLAVEKGFCEICGAELAMWPPASVTSHVYEKHADAMWPALREAFERFRAEPDTVEKQVSIKSGQAEYLVRILGARFDLYQKLVAGGVISSPKKG